MKIVLKISIAIVLFAFPAFAKYVAVLETVADQQAKETVSISDRQYLTNVLREQAVLVLPAEQNYTIMTRENIQQMLPPGKAIEDCEGSCLVETGKNIAADYVCQAHVGSFGGSLTLSAELYETAGNKLIASFNGRGADVNELLEIIKQKSPDFFRKIKGSSSFVGIGGIGELSGANNFSFAGKKKFIVEIVSVPAGALPTIDGKGIPKCVSTPCKVQVEEGNHRFVMSKERFEDAEIVVDINSNNQIVKLTLEPAYGWLEIKPVFEGNFIKREPFIVTVDGKQEIKRKIQLEPGIHDVRITHPCYDPAEFKVSIVKQKTEIFNKVMIRGKGGLELSALYKEVPQAVAVFIDSVESGSTPYVGEVPLCAEVMLKGKDWSESVDVTTKWHEVVQITHKLEHNPEVVAMNVADSVQTMANVAYNELDSNAVYKVCESIPANVESKPSSKTRGVLMGVSAAVILGGTIFAYVGNSNAKEASNKAFSNEAEYQNLKSETHSGQVLRGAGIALAIIGALGFGLSFAF